jgi:thiamine-monophosphate kinase
LKNNRFVLQDQKISRIGKPRALLYNSLMNEFELINTYFMHSRANGDDAAILNTPPNHSLVTSIDTLVEGRHFLATAAAFDIAYKTLAVNISDIAAMGARPKAFLLSLTLPEINESWVKDFSAGLYSIANQFELEHIGGDLTKGPLSMSCVIFGEAPIDKALKRSGAQAGDTIYVSGVLGDAAAALHDKGLDQTRLNRPLPRVELGLALRDIATSCIDISDGLVQDLQHILTASNKGAIINTNLIPFNNSLEHALNGGDDYELCFTAPSHFQKKLEELSKELSLPITTIGTVQDQKELIILDKNNNPIDLAQNGYQHF